MTPAQDPFYIVKEEIQESVDELDKTIVVAARDPAWYGLNECELEKRKRWTKIAHTQVDAIWKTIEVGTEKCNLISFGRNGLRQELMHLPNDIATQIGRSNPYHDNDEFISSESYQQMLLIRQQDEELDELSASVQRIGGVGLTIHEELIGQERVALVMKKAAAKG